MKKIKGNEIIKVVATTALSIGLFSSSFIGINHIAFAAATNNAATNHSVAITSNTLQDINVVPESYPYPLFNVESVMDLRAQQNTNHALSAQQVAELGARYIWEVLGENINGYTVHMSYYSPEYNARAYWIGMVSTTKSTRDSFLTFKIDAITGERISIQDFRRDDVNLPSKSLSSTAYADLMNQKPPNIERYIQLAEEYAQKHFNFTKVVNTIYTGMNVLATGSVRDLATDRFIELNNRVITYKETTLMFTVTDETGREANLTISMEAERLHSLTTERNDIIPGFEFWRGGASTQNPRSDRNSYTDFTSYGEGISPEEAEIIRNDPTHPLYDRYFGRLNGGK